MRTVPYTLLLLCSCCILGCKPSGPAMFPVSGVTWQGKPLSAGDIVFVAEDNRGVPSHGRIQDGRYQLRVTAGHQKVAVYAERSTSKPDLVMGQAPREQYLPAKYNTTTQLLPRYTSPTTPTLTLI